VALVRHVFVVCVCECILGWLCFFECVYLGRYLCLDRRGLGELEGGVLEGIGAAKVALSESLLRARAQTGLIAVWPWMVCLVLSAVSKFFSKIKSAGS
jgi:hypothetical protein